MMNIKIILRLLNIILVALLAGTSFGIWIGFSPHQYSVQTYIEQQQNLINSLHTLMVSMVIITTVLTIYHAFVHRNHKPDMLALLSAAAFLISCIFISRFGNLPLQKEMFSWRPDSYPQNWMILRDQWWQLHIYRTIAELLALFLITLTFVQKN